MLVRLFIAVVVFSSSFFQSHAQVSGDSLVRIKAFKADSLADVHRKRNRLDSAIFYNKRSLQFSRKINDHYAAAGSLIKLGEIYEWQKKQREALEFFRSSVVAANKSKDLQLRVKAYNRLIAAFRTADKYKEAYQSHVALTQLNDSINQLVAQQRLKEQDQLAKNLESSRTEAQGLTENLNTKIRSLEDELRQTREEFATYRTRSLYLFGILAGLALAFLISRVVVKSKLKRERKRNQVIENERMQIANDIRSDLDSGLAKINLYSQGVYDTPSSAEVKKKAGSIQEISSRLLDDIRDVIWNVSAVDPTLQDLAKNINQYGEDYFRDMTVEMVSQSPEKLPNITMEKPSYRAIFVVVKEIFQEIAKQSRAMNVFVTFSLQDDHLNITIKDDGLGLQYDPDDKDDWYLRMKSRLQPIGGLLNVTKEEQGTRLRLDIRLNISKKDRARK